MLNRTPFCGYYRKDDVFLGRENITLKLLILELGQTLLMSQCGRAPVLVQQGEMWCVKGWSGAGVLGWFGVETFTSFLTPVSPGTASQC